MSRETHEKEKFVSLLHDLCRGIHVKVVESDFAVDSSGFTTSRFIRWFDHQCGVVRQ
jgi:hypothetical protein